jgi:hypothetical protein
MNRIKEELQTELDNARSKCSTNDSWNYPYSYGIEKAIDIINKNEKLSIENFLRWYRLTDFNCEGHPDEDIITEFLKTIK